MSERKKVDFTLEFILKGKVVKKQFEISFVSNRVLKWFEDMTKIYNNIELNFKKILNIKKEMLSDHSNVEKYQKEIDGIKKEIESFDSEDIFKEKVWRIIERILTDNGYTAIYDEWYDGLQPDDVLKFVTTCCLKDKVAGNGSKKK